MLSAIQNFDSVNQNQKKVWIRSNNSIVIAMTIIFEVAITILDYALGAMIGAVGGWFIGLFIGHLYQDLFEPLYLASFEEVRFWYYLPQTFGQYSAVIAAYAGVFVVFALSVKRLMQETERADSQSEDNL